jgi:alkylation response protein AidB-like acyl-CoA dehydrogenase
MTEATGRFIRIVRELGRGFAERAARKDLTGEFVAENYAEMKALKLFSAGVPETLGGGGASHTELCELLRKQFHPLPESKQLVFTGRVAMGLSPV